MSSRRVLFGRFHSARMLIIRRKQRLNPYFFRLGQNLQVRELAVLRFANNLDEEGSVCRVLSES